MVGGQLSREAWDLYGTLRLAILVEDLSHIHKIEVSYGDRGIGTILNITFVPGTTLKEKFTKVDNQKRLKEVDQVIEGGYLELGFTFYRVQFEVIGKGSSDHESSCIIRTTIEYDVKEFLDHDAAAATKYNHVMSYLSIEPLAKIMEAAKHYLLKSKSTPAKGY
ncbi:hypothetical protein I3843_05G193700 [Carya illinoinensis]|nr:hypothetical protein I3843_05G193700 [Carya illinoinensis]